MFSISVTFALKLVLVNKPVVTGILFSVPVIFLSESVFLTKPGLSGILFSFFFQLVFFTQALVCDILYEHFESFFCGTYLLASYFDL